MGRQPCAGEKEPVSRAGFLQLPKLKLKSYLGRQRIWTTVRSEEALLGAVWSSQGSSESGEVPTQNRRLFGTGANLSAGRRSVERGRVWFPPAPEIRFRSFDVPAGVHPAWPGLAPRPTQFNPLLLYKHSKDEVYARLEETEKEAGTLRYVWLQLGTPLDRSIRSFCWEQPALVCVLLAGTQVREETHVLVPVVAPKKTSNRSVWMYGKYTEPPERHMWLMHWGQFGESHPSLT